MIQTHLVLRWFRFGFLGWGNTTQSQARGKKKDKDFVDLIGRKKWDLEEYERKAQEKLDAEAEADRLEKLKERRHRQMIVRDPLRQRTKEVSSCSFGLVSSFPASARADFVRLLFVLTL